MDEKEIAVNQVNKLFAQNKLLAQELKSQLDLNQQIEEEKNQCLVKLEKIKRDIELCSSRDEINIKRNAALSRENRLLREKCSHLKIENEALRKEMEKSMKAQRVAFEDRLERIEYMNYRLDIDLIAKDAKLQKAQKVCCHLQRENKTIKEEVREKARRSKVSRDGYIVING